MLPVDPTICWADPNELGMVEPDNEEEIGPAFVTSLYQYPNRQQSATLWYHDHALGIIRLNVMVGLAGFYIIKDPKTTGQIMQFTVMNSWAEKPKKIPEKPNKVFKLIEDSGKRTLVLFEVEGENGPVAVLLNGQNWSAPVSEMPEVGSTEEWEFVNLTMDTHPMHLHLVQFQISSRQAFRVEDYRNDWIALNEGEPPFNHPTEVLPVEGYLIGDPIKPDPNEIGWKDTVRSNPGEVTRIRVRFAPQDISPCVTTPGKNFYPFSPQIGPGYVWHCHILDHEDNEMMRPYVVVSDAMTMK